MAAEGADGAHTPRSSSSHSHSPPKRKGTFREQGVTITIEVRVG